MGSPTLDNSVVIISFLFLILHIQFLSNRSPVVSLQYGRGLRPSITSQDSTTSEASLIQSQSHSPRALTSLPEHAIQMDDDAIVTVSNNTKLMYMYSSLQ